MNTPFILMAQYGAKAVIPAEDVCKDYFPHLTPRQFVRKIDDGAIDLPLVRIEKSRQAARGVFLNDLARWIDARAEAASKECDQIHGRR